MCVNWLFCHDFNGTRQSIERKLPLEEWEESVFPHKNRETGKEGEAGRQTGTKIDVTSRSYFQLGRFDQLTFLFSDVESLVCRKPRLWHCENISQTLSMYFRVVLQEISPRTKSEVMTHKRPVPVKSHNMNATLLEPYTKTILVHFFSLPTKKWQMKCESLVKVVLPLRYYCALMQKTQK